MAYLLGLILGVQLAFGQTRILPIDTAVTDEVHDKSGKPGVISQEPEIRLPNLPPKSSSGAWGNEQNPPTETERKSGNSMSSIGASAFPGLTCPLTENRPHQDLVKAIQNLARVVVITPECQNSADLAKMNQEIQRMIQAGGNLMGLWNNPELLVQSNQSLSQFQSSIQDMINGINRVTSTLQSNAFLNSNCGQNLMTGTGLLLSISDLVSAFAPFALVGAAMNPSLKVALPYILGITGVGSVSKIIKTMHDQNTLDMSRAEHRQAVLDNVCEYSKISQRVRFLQLAQSGQIDLITSELNQMSLHSKNILMKEFGRRVFDINKIHQDYSDFLELLAKQGRPIRSQHDEISKDLKGASPELICLITKELVASNDEKQYPLNAVKHYRQIISLQQKTLIYQSTLISTEQKTRERLKRISDRDSSCSLVGQTYLQIIERIITNGEQTLGFLKKSLESQLAQDPDYRAFSSREKTITAEIDFLTKIKNLLAQLNLDNAVIDKLELDSRMYELRQALFGTPRGVVGLRGQSPAMAWLDFAWAQHLRASNQFNQEYESLAKDTFAVSRSMRADFFKRDEKGHVIRDKWGYPVRYSNPEIDQMILDDLRAARSLKSITPKIAPVGSDNHVLLCRRLENIWISWAAAMDHLSASQFFCQYISAFFDSRTEESIIARCEGKKDVYGRVVRHSEISQRLLDIQKSKDKDKATIVSNKLNELQCPKPTSDVLK
jgi:hypothetical protein